MYLVVVTLLLVSLIIQNITIKKYKNSAYNTIFRGKVNPFDWLCFWVNNLRDCAFLVDKKNKETYMATLIHDLKTPNSAQIRILNMLLSGYFGELTAEQKEILKEALLSEKYISEIVSNILTAYKCDCGELKLKKQFFDIAGTLNEVYKSLNFLAEERNQKININYHCSKLIYYGDKLQITRVITNLLSNAIKYGFRGSLINVDIFVNSKKINFTVENETTPIPDEKIRHIFDKFTAGMTHYNSASTGLGLYLSKRIIEMHGGRIFAKCTSDGLCTFGFVLRANSSDKEFQLIKNKQLFFNKM